MKVLGYALGGLFVVLAAIVVVVIFFSGDVIRSAVTEIGPKMTKAEVRLAEVDLSLTSGEASLKGLRIGNPKGFNTEHAFRLGSIAVKIDTGTIGSDTIVINEIIVDSPNVIAEFEKLSFNPLKAQQSIRESMETSNFAAIQRNVNEYIGSKPSSGGEAASSSEGPKLIVEKLRMNDIRVRAVAQSGLEINTQLPPFNISLDNIGKSEGGLKPEQLAAVIIPEVQKAITDGMIGPLSNAAKELVSKMGDAAKEGMKAVTEGAGKMGETMGGAASGAAEGAGEAVKGVGDAVKGLLGGDK